MNLFAYKKTSFSGDYAYDEVYFSDEEPTTYNNNTHHGNGLFLGVVELKHYEIERKEGVE